MAEKENIDPIEERKRGGVWRLYSSEVVAALVIIVLVIGIAFFVNMFFYGFDLPELAFSEPVVLEEEFDGELTELRYGEMVDSRIYPDLQEMFDEMRAAGLEPRVVQGYRTRDEQKERLDNKIREYMGYGKSREEARELAVQWEAEPGSSEHETGLCVDISSDSGDNESANAVWEWMDENCSRFGFIKRYPNDKSSITGVKGEPWHYRYVGPEAAQEITDRNTTLEEYLGAVR